MKSFQTRRQALSGSLAAATVAWLALAVATQRSVDGGQARPVPETILYNAKIVTVDKGFSYAEAVAIAGGRFTAVGTTAAVRKLAGPSTRQVDLKGRTVIPGLMDNHLHNAGGGPGSTCRGRAR